MWGVSFTGENIFTFDTATGNWQKNLDGSDTGMSGSGSRDINAFTIMSDRSVIFSVIGVITSALIVLFAVEIRISC